MRILRPSCNARRPPPPGVPSRHRCPLESAGSLRSPQPPPRGPLGAGRPLASIRGRPPQDLDSLANDLVGRLPRCLSHGTKPSGLASRQANSDGDEVVGSVRVLHRLACTRRARDEPVSPTAPVFARTVVVAGASRAGWYGEGGAWTCSLSGHVVDPGRGGGCHGSQASAPSSLLVSRGGGVEVARASQPRTKKPLCTHSAAVLQRIWTTPSRSPWMAPIS